MAIKIDWQDLQKRYLGWQEVVKVMLNGGEIRPNTVPPVQPTYHIVWDFTQWSLPSWWNISGAGSITYSNNWIALDTSWWTDSVIIKNQNSMPSLVNASRIKIDYDFYRTWASTQALYPYLRLQWWIYENLYDRRSLQSSVFFESPDYAAQEWHTVDTGSHGGLSFELWKYTLSIDVDLMNWIVTQTITSPNQTTATISRDDVHIFPNMVSIRNSDEFRITLYEWITMSDMNMYIWYTIPPVSNPWLCFTAKTGGSTIELDKIWNPTIVTLETSTDWETWTTYTFWTPITLSNIWDKIYWRNTSNVTTGFSTSTSAYYNFYMAWGIDASWDVTSLINKKCTDTITTANCFSRLFESCYPLRTPPELPATILASYCYFNMFRSCTWLRTLPQLPATTLANYCYSNMFYGCTSIELSEDQLWLYQTPYRIPTSWTAIGDYNSTNGMFNNTWWTFTGSPILGRIYYTSNTVI